MVSSAVAGGQGEKVGHYTALRYEWVDRRERWAAFKMHSTVNLFQEWKLNRGGGKCTAVTASESCQYSKVHKYAPFIPARRYFHVLLVFLWTKMLLTEPFVF